MVDYIFDKAVFFNSDSSIELKMVVGDSGYTKLQMVDAFPNDEAQEGQPDIIFIKTVVYKHTLANINGNKLDSVYLDILTLGSTGIKKLQEEYPFSKKEESIHFTG